MSKYNVIYKIKNKVVNTNYYTNDLLNLIKDIKFKNNYRVEFLKIKELDYE